MAIWTHSSHWVDHRFDADTMMVKTTWKIPVSPSEAQLDDNAFSIIALGFSQAWSITFLRQVMRPWQVA